MRASYRLCVLLLILLYCGHALGVTTNTQAIVRGNAVDSTTLLVKFFKNVPEPDISAVSASVGATSHSFKGAGRVKAGAIKQWRVFKLPASANINQVRKALLTDKRVSNVEYNYQVKIENTPDDTSYSLLWGLNNTGQTGGTPDADIDAPEAWDITTGSASVIVAVIDTGVDYNHEDLASNIWTNTGEIPGNGVDDDNNGYVDDVHGYDFVNNDGDPFDDHGHGTHVSGTIAAVGNNGKGVVGVNWRASIMAVKFLDASGSGYTDDAINALLYAINNGAKISNNSWGGGGFSQAMLDAINAADNAGSLFVAAAGNSSSNNDLSPHYPSSYDAPNVISVAATDHNDLLAGFSSYGATSVDLGAPGVDIYSTVPTSGNICCSNSSGYMYLSGTSMATPHVSGAAALIMSYFTNDTHLQVKQRILSTVQPIPALTGKTLTGGRLNVFNAMENDTIPPDPVSDLSVADAGSFSIQLAWTASGDDGSVGTASSYDIRYSTSPIDPSNFDSAIAVPAPAPAPSGSAEQFTINDLQPATTYYIAIKVIDNVGNVSEISNVVSTTTLEVQTIYNEDFENGLTHWTVSGTDGIGGPALWHLSQHRYSSPSNALYYGTEATLTYNTGAANSGSAVSDPIDLSQAPVDSQLKFSYYLRTENLSPYDTARVSISTDDGATWQEVWSSAYDSAGSTMSSVTIDLSNFIGSNIRLRFGFDTIDSVFNDYEGWVVDDIQILAAVTGVPNQAPMANAGGPYTGSHNIPVVFDGSGSSDPDGDTLTYSWDFGDGSSGNGVSPSHTYVADGSYTMTLTVSDGYLSNMQTTSVDIINEPPTADAGGPYTGKVNTAIAFDGSNSFDPNNDSLTYDWDFGDGTTLLDGGATPTHVYKVLGQLTVILTVDDNKGASAQATTQVQVVNNLPPVAVAGADQNVWPKTAVTLDGGLSHDDDGTITAYAWTQTAGPAVTLSGADTPNLQFDTPQVKGQDIVSLTFQLTVTDNDGATGTDDVIINVSRSYPK